MLTSNELFQRRRRRTRYQVKKTAAGRPRLHVHRSNKQIYAQVIDDLAGATVAAASSLEPDLRAKGAGGTVEAAAEIGKLVAERAKAAGVEQVVFDRGGYRYHGRVKALAEAAREAGLTF